MCAILHISVSDVRRRPIGGAHDGSPGDWSQRLSARRAAATVCVACSGRALSHLTIVVSRQIGCELVEALLVLSVR